MLKLDIVQHNPAIADLLTAFGVVLLAAVAALTLGLWLVVVRGRARRQIREFNDSASDSGIEALRHERLVARPTPAAQAPQGVVVADLERTEEPDPERTAEPETTPH
jgi:hypothetical protein